MRRDLSSSVVSATPVFRSGDAAQPRRHSEPGSSASIAAQFRALLLRCAALAALARTIRNWRSDSAVTVITSCESSGSRRAAHFIATTGDRCRTRLR